MPEQNTPTTQPQQQPTQVPLDQIFGNKNTQQIAGKPSLGDIFSGKAQENKPTASVEQPHEENFFEKIGAGATEKLTDAWKSAYEGAKEEFSKGTVSGGIHGIARTLEGVVAPLGVALDTVTGGGIGTGIDKAGNALGNAAPETLNKVNDFFDAHPDAKKFILQDLPTFLNTASLGVGGGEFKGGNPLESIKSSVKSGADEIKPAISEGAETISSASNAIKEKIAPSVSSDELAGRVVQGKTGDIQSAKSGLSNLDTSKVKSYEDLTKTASDKITELSNKQDELLEKDPTKLKIQQLATKVGDKEAAHNYVIDAVKQLKDHFTATNDIANLQKIEGYEKAIDPVNGEGLSKKDVNDIARMHGSNLNAYNANGQLASGLTKQAAENTRAGLKNTVRNLMNDKESQAIDKQISDTYTVKDLSAKMQEKVNTATQRMSKPNFIQKVGGIVGKAVKITGVGDVFKSVLGLDKLAGSSSLSPVEIEAQLSKNLSRLEKAMAKDDEGFAKDVASMIKENK